MTDANRDRKPAQNTVRRQLRLSCRLRPNLVARVRGLRPRSRRHNAGELAQRPDVACLPAHTSLVGATVATIVVGLTMARVGGLGLAMRG
jgi:hypothetical protein